MKKDTLTTQTILSAMNKPKGYVLIALGVVLSLFLIVSAIYEIVNSVVQPKTWGILMIGIALATAEFFYIWRKCQNNRAIKCGDFDIYDTVVIDKQARCHSRIYDSNYYLSFDLGDRPPKSVRVRWDEYRQATVGSRYFVVCTEHGICAFSAKTHGVHRKLRKFVVMIRNGN